MIIIKETFTAKPGQASKLAKKLKDAMESSGIRGTRILTDMTGGFNRVVMETEADNLGDIEKRMKEYLENSDLREKMSGYTDMYLTGEREIFQVWE